MHPKYYKFAGAASFVLFLFTVLKPQSIALLLLSAYFLYIYCIKTINSLTQKDLIQLLPKKIKKHIQEKSLAEYIATLQIVQKTPMLNYFVPFLKEMGRDKKNSLQIIGQSKTTSAITMPNGTSLYEENHTNETRLKMIRQPLSSETNLGDQLIQHTLKMGLKNHVLSQVQHSSFNSRNKLSKQQPGTMTTCQSTNDHLPKRPYNSLGKRKSSLVIKKKFAEQSSSNEQPLSNINHKRLHKSTSQSKLSTKQNDSLSLQPRDGKQSNKSLQPHIQNPIKTVEQYVKALIWMMKRLLGLRKMTSKIRRASMVSVASAAALFWLMVYFQIKMDKKKGKIIFKTLKALVGTILVLSATGTTSILGYKLYKRITVGEEPPRRPQQFSLFGDGNHNTNSKR